MKKQQEVPDDSYPGQQYQNLFNYLSGFCSPMLQSEMDEIIDIVHKDFPRKKLNSDKEVQGSVARDDDSSTSDNKQRTIEGL